MNNKMKTILIPMAIMVPCLVSGFASVNPAGSSFETFVPSFSTLFMSLADTEETAALPKCQPFSQNADDLWARLELVTEGIKGSSSYGSSMVSAAAIEKEDPDIIHLLAEVTGLDLNAPKTWGGLIKSYLTKGCGGFIVLSILATCIYRLSLVSTSPIDIYDLLLLVASRVFWEVQEWAIHASWFHGTNDCRAQDLFKTHDRHHDLPYYHISVEPLRLVVVWWMVIFSLTQASVHFGASPSIMATLFAAYQVNALGYTFLHATVHSRVTFTKGSWLEQIKLNHVKHHISPKHYLNIGPDNVDKMMKTDTYEKRLLKSGKIDFV